MLPHLDKAEKRALYEALKREQEEEELRHFQPDYPVEMLRRPPDHTGGYSAPASRAAPRQEEPRTSQRERASGSTEPPPPKGVLPEPVRKKRLEEFRRRLYDAAVDRRGRLRPSEASDIPRGDQELCKHPFEKLVWGANQAAHWANCRECKLHKVLYYSHDHGALVVEEPPVEAHEVHLMSNCDIILDTGCRTAVAGEAWHAQFQQELQKRGLEFDTVEHEEVFRFGAGKPVLSTEAHVYPVQLGGDGPLSYLRLAVVRKTTGDDRVGLCPALVGPSEMRRWGVKMDFAEQTLQLGDGGDSPWRRTRYSATRHPGARLRRPRTVADP